MMILEKDWKWFGIAGHFICADRCQFHMTTQIGKFLISTVGEMKGDKFGKNRNYEFEMIGAYIGTGKKPIYETMVFEAGKACQVKDCMCGLPKLKTARELWARHEEFRGEAQKTHMDACYLVARGEIEIPKPVEDDE